MFTLSAAAYNLIRLPKLLTASRRSDTRSPVQNLPGAMIFARQNCKYQRMHLSTRHSCANKARNTRISMIFPRPANLSNNSVTHFIGSTEIARASS